VVFFTTAPQLNKDLEMIFELDPNSTVTILNELTKKILKKGISLNFAEYNQIKPIVLKGEFVVCAEYHGVVEHTEINDNQILGDLKKYGKKRYMKYTELNII